MNPNAIITVSAELVDTSRPLGQNPAAVYLASLTSERSRRVLAGDLRTLGALLLGLNYRSATVNRMLSALRGVLKEAWRLGDVGGALRALRDWLAVYRENGALPLFVPILKSGRLTVRRMSA